MTDDGKIELDPMTDVTSRQDTVEKELNALKESIATKDKMINDVLASNRKLITLATDPIKAGQIPEAPITDKQQSAINYIMGYANYMGWEIKPEYKVKG
jgi:hypothetical protein